MDNRTEILASFPRPFPLPAFDCFQYEIRRGKAWEIWSHVMMSGRQMVDTWEGMGGGGGRGRGGTIIVIPVEGDGIDYLPCKRSGSQSLEEQYKTGH